MKSKKTRIALLIGIALIAVLLTVGAVVLVGASDTAPTLSIDYCNLSFKETIYIQYAVAADADDVQLLIWTEPQTNYTVGTQNATLTSNKTQTINGSSYKIFNYTRLSAKQMTDVIYARVYTKVNEVDCYSEVHKYSILQYVYNKLGKTGTGTNDEDLQALLKNMLAYGAAAQNYFKYNTDLLATANFYQISLTGGHLDDGCTHGLYLANTNVNVSVAATNEEGLLFAYWADSNGNPVGLTPKCTLPVKTKNETYTPVYSEYSYGLEFVSNGDKTCYVKSIGVCDDTDLRIPLASPDEETVVGIATSAFSGNTQIKSISIPATVTDVGANAFEGCTSIIKTENGMQYVDNWLITANANQTNVTLRDGTMGIAAGAFDNCPNLATIILPRSIVGISASAFNGCTALNRVYYSGSVSEWSNVTVVGNNTPFTSANLYYYSATKPIDTTRYYWYYNSKGNPAKWNVSGWSDPIK